MVVRQASRQAGRQTDRQTDRQDRKDGKQNGRGAKVASAPDTAFTCKLQLPFLLGGSAPQTPNESAWRTPDRLTVPKSNGRWKKCLREYTGGEDGTKPLLSGSFAFTANDL